MTPRWKDLAIADTIVVFISQEHFVKVSFGHKSCNCFPSEKRCLMRCLAVRHCVCFGCGQRSLEEEAAA